MVRSQIKCMDCGMEDSPQWMRCYECQAVLCINCGNRGMCPLCNGKNIQY